jgi:hypothetical protein
MQNQIGATECFKEGWELIKDEYPLMLGVSLFSLFLMYVLPVILQGPVYCGMYILLFERMRGRRISFDRFFDGFNVFLPSFLVTIITLIPGLLLVIIGAVIAIILVATGVALEDEGIRGATFGSLGLLVILAVIGSLIAISFQILMLFALPLVAEARLGAIDACKKSARAVLDNLGFVVTLVVLQSLLALAGILACFIGLVLVFPLMFASTAVAYRHIFGLHSTPDGAMG